MRHVVAVLTIVLCPVIQAAAAGEEQPPDTDSITVVASGTGADESSALRQALNNAVTQAVGTIVDAETVIKNDQIIRDQILTASNAIVSKSEPVGQPVREGGLVTVRIKAVVEKRNLTQRLKEANVISKQVDGGNLFSRAVTELQQEHDTAAMARRVFSGFPGNVMTAESSGEPRLVKKDEVNAMIAVTVEFHVDQEKYTQWLKAFGPILARLAEKSETVRWDPAKIKGFQPLNTPSAATILQLEKLSKPFEKRERAGPDRWGSLSVPKREWAKSYTSNGNLWDWPPTATKGRKVLIIIEGQGSSRASVLYVGEELHKAALRASLAIPIVDVAVKNRGGEDLDGVTRVACFQPPLGWSFFASPFFHYSFDPTYNMSRIEPSLPTLGWARNEGIKEFTVDMKPNERQFAEYEAKGVLLMPYLSGRANGLLLVTRFANDFVFKIPTEKLAELKTVEVKVQSRNNLTEDDQGSSR